MPLIIIADRLGSDIWIRYAIRFLPPDVQAKLMDRMVLISADGLEAGMHMPQSVHSGRDLIFFPQCTLPPREGVKTDDPSVQRFIQIFLHECAHVYLNHKSPALDGLNEKERNNQEIEATQMAESWIMRHQHE